MKRLSGCLLVLLLGTSYSFAEESWKSRDELYSACGQDPMPWCVNLLQKMCGSKVTPTSIICARRNYDKISKRDLAHGKCMLRVCGMEDGTRNSETAKCFEKFDRRCD